MTDQRRRRFEQIERPRGEDAEAPDASPGTDLRFGGLGAPPPLPPPPPGAAGHPFQGGAAGPVAPGHTDRFRPAAERPLEVETRGGDAQPFIRCARCQTDSSRFAARCTTCGEPLDTDEQRAFNERLWAERQAIAEAEAGEQAARAEALEASRAEAAAARRAMAETMAREVGQAERRRLDAGGFGEPGFGPLPGDLGGGGWGDAGRGGGSRASGRSFGLRLLSALPPPWGVVAGVGAVALVAGLFLARPTAGLVAGAILASLLSPPGWRRRRRW